VYALKNAKDVSALKAISQNLMHQNLSITDGVYGILSETDVRHQITTLGKMLSSEGGGEVETLNALLIEAIKRLDQLAPKRS
jgi:hypothetical protein